MEMSFCIILILLKKLKVFIEYSLYRDTILYILKVKLMFYIILDNNQNIQLTNINLIN